jgi:malate permease and related proteins
MIGFIIGRKLPAPVPTRLAQFLFWVGVPISIVAFLRQTDLSGKFWIAPAIGD